MTNGNDEKVRQLTEDLAPDAADLLYLVKAGGGDRKVQVGNLPASGTSLVWHRAHAAHDDPNIATGIVFPDYQPAVGDIIVDVFFAGTAFNNAGLFLASTADGADSYIGTLNPSDGASTQFGTDWVAAGGLSGGGSTVPANQRAIVASGGLYLTEVPGNDAPSTVGALDITLVVIPAA